MMETRSREILRFQAQLMTHDAETLLLNGARTRWDNPHFGSVFPGYS